MKIWKMATLATIVLGLALAPASAQLWGNPKVVEKLGLSDEQVQRLQETAIEHQKQAIQRNSQVKVLELELRQLWKADTPDEAKILAKVKELAKVRQEQMVARTEHRLAMHKVLTPEQRQQVRKGIARGIAQRRFGQAGVRGPRQQGRSPRQPARGRAPAGQGPVRQGPVGQGQGLGPCGPTGPAWGPPGGQPGMAPGFGPGRPGRQQGFRAPAPGEGAGQRQGRRQWGAWNDVEAPSENHRLAWGKGFGIHACPFLAEPFFEEFLNTEE